MSIDKYETLNQERKMQETKKRVAAYCRVSTDNEDQANSFESQQRYFRQYIERNPDWELYAIFADEGISGTNTKKRKEFNRMIACAKNGEFDLIITKEISRFARNTLDSIFYTRDLKKHGVGVIFLNDNINTLDGDAELRLAIMSSIAQEESRRTSERVKWGQRRQMEQGVVFGRSMLGYDVKDGKMTINEEGAKVVRLIFHKFVDEGKGTHVIARELREEGIEPMRVKEWQNTVILRVIRNEKYCGDLVQKKTYTPDFLSHEKKYNRGQEEFVIIKDHHEPIISRELFDKANRILDAKSLSQEGKAKHSSRYPFSGKIKCGRCGASYVARYKTRKDGSRYKAWRCYEAANHGRPHIDKAGNPVGCSGESIRNEDGIYLLYLVCRELKINRQRVVDNLIKTIDFCLQIDLRGTSTSALWEQMEEAGKKRTGLIDLYTSGDIDKSEFTTLRAKYDEDIEKLKSKMEGIEQKRRMMPKRQELMADIKNAIDELINGIQYEDEFYTQILDKMVVGDKNHIDVYLKMLPHKWSFTAAKGVTHTEQKKVRTSEVERPTLFGQGQVGRRNENRFCADPTEHFRGFST
ncbi:MAG: recombinase family protein [Lachnospiraceae bacterium]|nr:recombinase family protein [Lachnospiraceae bacterium]